MLQPRWVPSGCSSRRGRHAEPSWGGALLHQRHARWTTHQQPHAGPSLSAGPPAESSSTLSSFIAQQAEPIDGEKEAARRERRTIFTFGDWKRHRSSARFIHHLSTIPESGVIRGVLLHVCVFVLLATGVAAYNYAWMVGTLPLGLPAPPTIAIEPIQLTSFALSLLLVFRTNASYSRWQEARKKFGQITTTGRDIARQALAWFRREDVSSKRCLARWLLALAKCSMCHLRDGEHDVHELLQGVLRPQELQWLESSQHRPNFCIQMITRIISRAGLATELVLRMDENISKLVEAVSSCERIINTPIPMSYTRHTARFLMVWLACLPFSLWGYCGWAMVPIAALISFVLLGIEEIGVYIEEPFSLLPLENLCDKLDRILTAMLNESTAIDKYLEFTDKDELLDEQQAHQGQPGQWQGAEQAGGSSGGHGQQQTVMTAGSGTQLAPQNAVVS